MPAMAETERVPLTKDSVESGVVDVRCRLCGRLVRLWFNGGELDRQTCCGVSYALEATGYELIVSKP